LKWQIAYQFQIHKRLNERSDEEKVDPTLFKQIVGSLRYLCNSRPNIFYSRGMISKLMNYPKKSHMTAAKRFLIYVKGSMKFSLLYPTSIKGERAKLVSYSDSDRGGDKVYRRSTSPSCLVYLEKTSDCIIYL
jgi:hypothetical protein